MAKIEKLRYFPPKMKELGKFTLDSSAINEHQKYLKTV